MKTLSLRILILFAILILAGPGCSTIRAPEGSVPVEERSSTADTSTGVEIGAGAQTGGGFRTQSPAVNELLATAQLDMEGGKPESAAATMERALRLEPKDALLWYRLALIRHLQGQWQQVLTLARKSISLAAGNPNLQLQNWRLIALAYEHLKDHKGTEHAKAMIQRLEQQLGERGEG